MYNLTEDIDKHKQHVAYHNALLGGSAFQFTKNNFISISELSLHYSILSVVLQQRLYSRIDCEIDKWYVLYLSIEKNGYKLHDA